MAAFASMESVYEDRLELTWFEDHEGRPVRNYRAHLAVLDEEFVDVDWLHKRATAEKESELLVGGPASWQQYLAGKVERFAVPGSVNSH